VVSLSGPHRAPRHRAPRRPIFAARHTIAASVTGVRVAAAVAVVGATGGAALLATTGGAASRADVHLAAATGGGKAAAVSSSAAKASPRERALVARRTAEQASRGGSRPPLVATQRAAKSKALPAAQQDVSRTLTRTVDPTDPQDIAKGMLSHYGWSADQFSCLNEIYMRESRWNPSAANPYSGAYGIPQALPGDKMAAYGSDWQTNPATQLAWGLSYIRDRYGSPCGAWSFWESHNYY
jgi:hypothetical protein